MLSRYVHAVVIRAGAHATVAELADAAEVPVVNGLTPLHHPCQALADLLTLRERFGDLDGVSVAYVGDGNNVARSRRSPAASPTWRSGLRPPRGTSSSRGSHRFRPTTCARLLTALTRSIPTSG